MTEHMNPDDLAKQISTEVKETYGKLDKKTADLGEVVEALKKAVESKAETTDLDNTLKGIQDEVKKLAGQADELDKKLARPGRGGEDEAKSLGQQVAESDGYKSFAANGGGRYKFETKTIVTSDISVGSQTLYPGIPRSQAPMVMMPDRTLTVRDLLPVGRTTSNAIEYPRESAFTNNAAVVAEGAAKPESTFDLTLETAPVRTIAHYFRVSKQIFDDLGMLQGYIDGRLRYGVAYAEEGQILDGDGTGQNIDGILNQADTFPASVATSGIPDGTNSTMVDIVRWAKLQVRQSLYPATGVVLNPEDWATIELLKDANDAYLYSAFTSGAEPRLWGMRVVESDAITAGTFLVGSFAMGAQIWDREQANVVISTEDQDNIVKNLVTIRGEERLALTVYRPSAFVTGSFTLTA